MRLIRDPARAEAIHVAFSSHLACTLILRDTGLLTPAKHIMDNKLSARAALEGSGRGWGLERLLTSAGLPHTHAGGRAEAG